MKTIALRFVSILLIFSALLLTFFQWQSFSEARTRFPPGQVIASIPVGGLDRSQAAERIESVYRSPVELRYLSERIQVSPDGLGFSLGLEESLAAAEAQWLAQPSLPAFWDFLWNRAPAIESVELIVTTDESQLSAYLSDELASRYDQPSQAGRPQPPAWNFSTPQNGHRLLIGDAVDGVLQALMSPAERVVDLPVVDTEISSEQLDDLAWLLSYRVRRAGFPGVAEVYFEDLQTGEAIQLALRNGSEVEPGVAFTAASTMKLPIMVATMRREAEPPPEELQDLFERMIVLSENPPADRLMERIDAVRGPILVTEDLHKLGLENSFIGGYFYLGAPLLQQFETPANRRTDVNLFPDIYNQTTPAEMGRLLTAIYDCAQGRRGLLEQAFPGEISRSECEFMLSYLQRNHNGLMIEAGVPEGTLLAHKHGWIEEADGLLHTISDVGLVQSPGGDFVLVVYLYDFSQLRFSAANQLIAELANTAYNYFNRQSPAEWPFGPTQY